MASLVSGLLQGGLAFRLSKGLNSVTQGLFSGRYNLQRLKAFVQTYENLYV